MITYTHKRWRLVGVYSAAHFLVDFACAFLMFRGIAGTPEWYLCALLYNFCAFAMQMPLGILADKWNRNFLFAVIGCILVGAAYGLWQVPFAAVIIAGIGNGMFHVGGGIDVLNISEEKSGALGVFVSPGAFGIYFGTRLGKGSDLSAIPILLALLAAVALIFIVRRAQGKTYPKNAAFSLGGGTSSRMSIPICDRANSRAADLFPPGGVAVDQRSYRLRIPPAPCRTKKSLAALLPFRSQIGITAAVCLFLVVCLRSYVGLTLRFPWKSAGYWGIALVCAVVLGKTIGGFSADRFGPVKTSCVSLGLAALLFLIPQVPAAGVLSVLLFNMTMPITLWAMAKVFPGAKGFSFGLLTFGLFLGFLPVHLGVSAPSAPWLFALAAATSLALLWASLRKANL